MEELADLDPCSQNTVFTHQILDVHIAKKVGYMNSICNHCKSIQDYFVFLKCFCSVERERHSAYV